MADETQNTQANENSIAVGSINVSGSISGDLIVQNAGSISGKKTSFLHQLPQPPADFTGREDLIAQMVSDFTTHKGAATIGLTGMGGIGKTALGLVVAHKIKDIYPDAQIFIDLKGTTSPLSAMDIMRHVITTFEPEINLRALDETGMQAAYRSVLNERRALLFLDNARSTEQIASLQPPDTCAMLVTSRWTFHVPGLQSRRVDVMIAENAEKFLIRLCPRIGSQAAQLASACACLPLALRIAGSFLQVSDNWKVERYLTRLDDRKQILAALHQDREDAELKTEPDLLATFELSYAQLSQEAQKRWRVLGVFQRSFDAKAAQAMWETDENETLKLLSFFLRYSLLDYDENASRYSLHDLLADYAFSQMDEQEDHAARYRHASHYKDVLGAANDLYVKGGKNVLSGLRLFDLECENIRAGQDWASTSHGNNSAVAMLCTQYQDAGVSVLNLRQHPREKIHWLGAAISSARRISNRRGEGNALSSLGLAYADLGETRKAIEFFEQALVIDREIGDRRGEGDTLDSLGIAYKDLGETHKAIQFYEQALVIDREIGDRRGEGKTLGNLGVAYAVLGETWKAIEFYEQSLVIDREFGDWQGEGTDLGNLGVAYKNLGETRKAIEFYEGQLKVASKIGDRRSEGNALGNLGVAYKSLGEIHKAIEFYERRLLIACEIGDLLGEGTVLTNLGLALYDLEEKGRAVDLVKQALAIFETIESPYAECARETLRKWGACPEGDDSQAE